LAEPLQIEVEFISIFKDLMGSKEKELKCLNTRVVRGGSCLTIMQQRELIQEVTNEEIVEAIKSMPKDKVPGVDGFPIEFFTKNWKVVGKDVIAAVLHFFQTGRIHHAINVTAVTLIPKVKAPTKVSDYRPIACCTTLYKIIAKDLTNRLKLVISGLVDKAQSAFVKGRSIVDNFMVSHEIFKSYNRKWISPRYVLKVDLRKAYDTLDWGFLERLMSDMGFPAKFVQWIMKCISTVSYSLLLNGGLTEPFPAQRGLR